MTTWSRALSHSHLFEPSLFKPALEVLDFSTEQNYTYVWTVKYVGIYLL